MTFKHLFSAGSASVLALAMALGAMPAQAAPSSDLQRAERPDRVRGNGQRSNREQRSERREQRSEQRQTQRPVAAAPQIRAQRPTMVQNQPQTQRRAPPVQTQERNRSDTAQNWQNRGDRAQTQQRRDYRAPGPAIAPPAARERAERQADRRQDRRIEQRTEQRTERRSEYRGDRNRNYTDRNRNTTYRNGYRDGRRADARQDQRRYENYRHWDRRQWRSNKRYDWNNYRRYNRNLYSLGRYYSPYRDYRYSRLNVGFYLDSLFYSNRYWISDPWQYRLPEVYGPYRWVRYYDDVMLVNTYTGEVVDVIYDFFW